MPSFDAERGMRAQGFRLVCGVDEAGRGPLAGPVAAAAVILPAGANLPGLDDSKKLSSVRREALFEQITAQATAYNIALASVEEIERLNIRGATFLAMERAEAALAPPADCALIDGMDVPPGLVIPAYAIIRGDGSVSCIAAASILAKVARDRLMIEYAGRFPGYGFERHKGYGTAAHVDALRRLGPCEIHRASFLKKILS